MRRTPVAIAAVAAGAGLAGAAWAGPGPAGSGLGVPASAAGTPPDRYVLPGDDVFPEGVATRPGTDELYVTSTTDGTVFRGRLGRERMSVFLAPRRDGRVTAVGLRATRDRLVVAGGVSNLIFVYDLRTRRLVRRFSTGTGGFVNDVAITPGGDAYVTDSQRNVMFRIRADDIERRRGGTKALRPFVRLGDTPGPGVYSNGIAPAGRRHVLVGILTTSRLLRVDLRTRAVRPVDLGSSALPVPVPDGIVVHGRTAYVVNSGSRITKLALAEDYLRARVVRHITSPAFRLPTTVDVAGRRLLVVNSQFDQRGRTPELPFTVSSVPRP